MEDVISEFKYIKLPRASLTSAGCNIKDLIIFILVGETNTTPSGGL